MPRHRGHRSEAGWSGWRDGLAVDIGGSRYYAAGEDAETARPHYNFERQAADLLAAVRDGHEPQVTGTDGLRALEICLAAYRSAQTGKPVALTSLQP